MKKHFLILCILFSSNSLFAQKYALGIQSSWPTHGISGKIIMSEHHAGQAIFSLAGPYSSYTARYLYSLSLNEVNNELQYKPFFSSHLGLNAFKIDQISYNANGQFIREKITTTTFGYGLGAGVEINASSFEDLKLSTEILYSITDVTGYNWSYLQLGIGLHYYFK